MENENNNIFGENDENKYSENTENIDEITADETSDGGTNDEDMQPEEETRAMRKLRIRDEKRRAKASRAYDKRKRRQARIFEKYGIDADYAASETSIIRTIVRVLKKRYVSLLLMTAIVTAALGEYYYIASFDTASTVMMLNYEESSKGMAPNQARFNISDFGSMTVMRRAVETAGLENVIAPEDLAECVSVSPTHIKNTDDADNYYISTSYYIYYRQPKEITEISAENMLDVICNSYKELFFNEYTMNPEILSYDYDEVKDMDYTDIASLFSTRIGELDRYLSMRADEGGEFTSSETGETFGSLRKLVANLKDYDLDTYNAYIWESGVVRDKSRYENTLDYLNYNYSREKNKSYNEYDIRRDVIGYFSTAMSTSILIPTYNSKQEFYMSRTKTGVDYLASEAAYYLQNAKDLNLKQEKNKDRIEKLKNSSGASTEKAEGMIANMIKEFKRIEQLAVVTDREYINQKTRNYISFKSDSDSFLKRLPMDKLGMVAIAFFCAALFAYYKELRSVIRRPYTK